MFVSNNKNSYILVLCLFATGFSGIVAEYSLATLAAYLLGNSTIQWAMILSVMLFSMGIGSRLSKYITHNILEKFIIVEFFLSLLVSFSVLITYLCLAYASFNNSILLIVWRLDGVIIYVFSLLVGLLIGIEIPLVIRLNNNFESLRLNIANVMEKDYYGSLLGGIFFSFIALPFLGLEYTPFIIGGINFTVAIALYIQLNSMIDKKYHYIIIPISMIITISLVVGSLLSKSIINYGEQSRYTDKIVYQETSKYQKIIITEWKNNYWLYLNGYQQISSLDEHFYHEPFIHPAIGISLNPKKVLILGGGDGCAAREVLKYNNIKSITLVDIDPSITNLSKNHKILTKINGDALNNAKVKVINRDAFRYIEDTREYYDIIIIDFPDPRSIELSRLFSYEFYKICYQHLNKDGILVAQATSPYHTPLAFICIEKTIKSVGFNVISIHNQVPTLGEWGWVIASKIYNQETLKRKITNLKLSNIDTRWLDNESLKLITSFGKDIKLIDTSKVEINTLHNPIINRYYQKGIW